MSSLFSNIWGILIVILFFGGSIFIHELGHFLAAKWRGLQIDRFSIGFGPKIVAWKRGGVEYRLSWLPLGGYVALPQLADMRGIEGESSIDSQSLPQISYTDKVIVAVAGAVFNVLLAFCLASVLYFTGRPMTEARTSTEIGYVSDTLINSDGNEITAPSKRAGLQAGDIITAIDGRHTKDWDDVQQGIALSGGRNNDGGRLIDFEILRDGQTLNLPVEPILSSDYKIRQVGLASGYTYIVTALFPDSPAVKAGMKPGDTIISLNNVPIRNHSQLRDVTSDKAGVEMPLVLKRGEEIIETKITPEEVVVQKNGKTAVLTGIYDFDTNRELLHQTPFEQLRDMALTTVRNLGALLNRNSDIGLSHMSGPAGIIRVIWATAQYSLLEAIWFTIFINISLAFFNLLPIPVLDGGHIAFATISKLRGQPINPNIIASLQGSFMILLFSMIIYITYFDLSRWRDDSNNIDEVREQRVTPVFGKTSAAIKDAVSE